MAVADEYKDYLVDQLSEFGEVRAKKMFGGLGFFYNDTMFAMMGGGVFRLRADEQTIPDFTDRGMENYQPREGKKGMPYWEVPLDVLEDKMELKQWAIKAYEAALRGKK